MTIPMFPELAALDSESTADPRHATASQAAAALDRATWLACSASPAFFIDRYGHLYDAQARAWTRFRLWPAQAQALRTLAAHRLVVVLKARPLGMTWLAVGVLAFGISAGVCWGAVTLICDTRVRRMKTPHLGLAQVGRLICWQGTGFRAGSLITNQAGLAMALGPATCPRYCESPKPRINPQMAGKRIRPIPKPTPRPNDFARSSIMMIYTTQATIGTNNHSRSHHQGLPMMRNNTSVL